MPLPSQGQQLRPAHALAAEHELIAAIWVHLQRFAPMPTVAETCESRWSPKRSLDRPVGQSPAASERRSDRPKGRKPRVALLPLALALGSLFRSRRGRNPPELGSAGLGRK